jgi:hypothetical protein
LLLRAVYFCAKIILYQQTTCDYVIILKIACFKNQWVCSLSGIIMYNCRWCLAGGKEGQLCPILVTSNLNPNMIGSQPAHQYTFYIMNFFSSSTVFMYNWNGVILFFHSLFWCLLFKLIQREEEFPCATDMYVCTYCILWTICTRVIRKLSFTLLKY